jgi:hypothetical protein
MKGKIMTICKPKGAKAARLTAKAKSAALGLVCDAFYASGNATKATHEALRIARCPILTPTSSKEEIVYQKSLQREANIGSIKARLMSNGASADLRAQAIAILDAKGKDTTSKLKAGERRRTPQEEAMYTAARAAWSYALRTGGYKTADKRGGGKRGANTTPKDKAPAPKPKLTKALLTPKVATGNAYVQHVMMQASALMAFHDKNAKAATPQLSSAIADFAAAVKAAVGK